MKKISILFVTLFINTFVFSQHQADHWYFGIYAGLDFSSGSPVPVTDGALSTTEGCSSISDVLGNLLFYTNGVSVWNRNNQLMPNGTGLDGDISTSQSGLIVPDPASNGSDYYIFTLANDGGANGFRYSIVDMTEDSGLGDVITKNVLIQDNVTERMAAQKQLNGEGYWIVVHDWGSNAFDAYSLTSSGLQLTPVISNVGMVHTTAQIQNTYGQMKFSTCTDQLALATGYLDTVQLLDFDPVTGILSNPISLPMPDHVYGVEFSSAGNNLYVTNYDMYGTLLQYDLTSNIQDSIIASRKVLSLTEDLYALQLGPDYKIYVNKSFSSQLNVINSPNTPGYDCDYVDNALNLDPNYLGITSGLGLPEFPQNIFKTEGSCFANGINEVTASGKNLLYPNPSGDEFTVNLSNQHSQSTIVVFDAEGNRVAQFNEVSEGKISFGKNLSAGIYLVQIRNDAGVTNEIAVKIEE
ncbi:MAG TPA: T9SS type A sorting domain-containing protein [Chitinophagales bacterium]|nr:T9SS type A sorting domain-containing protein [Chitinophagales bacterium]